MNGVSRIFVVTALAVLSSLGALADATWKTAADGDWETSSNWSTEAVPLSTERAWITPMDNAYTVTVGSAQTVQGLTVSGNVNHAYSTRLRVDAPLTIDGANLAASYGEVSIGPHGLLEMKNQSGANSRLFLGARISVDGGAFVMTNGISTALYAGDTPWKSMDWGPSAFVMNSGNAYFKGSASVLYTSSSSYCNQIALHGGRMEMIDTSDSRNATLFYVETKGSGEVFVMDGDSELVFSQGGSMALGRGISTIAGNAKLTIMSPKDSNILTFAPYSSDSGCTATINIKDNAEVSAPAGRAFVFGKTDLRSVRTKGYLNVSGGTLTTGYRSELGTGTGEWEVNQTGGRMEFTRYGLHIGGVPYVVNSLTHANAQDMCCTSTVTVAGGVLDCSAGSTHGNTPNQSMCGFIVGAGLVGKTYSHLMNGWTDARLVLTDGGTILCGMCAKIIGVGKAVATVTQTGGSFTGDGAPTDQTWNWDRDSLVIGAFGGKGTYELRGGTVTNNAPLYVGGVTLGLLQRTDESGELPADTTGKAEGTLRISGGEMWIGRYGVVGRDGAGTIELSGDGALTINGYLTLTNSAVAGSQATVKVSVTGEQAPMFMVKGNLNIEAGSKLVVDATGFTGSQKVKIIDCARRNGDFAAEDITLTGGSDLAIRQADDGDIYLLRKQGLMILLR